MKSRALLYSIQGTPHCFVDTTASAIDMDRKLMNMQAAFPENMARLVPVVVLENTERGLVFDMRGIPERLRECEDPDMPDTLIPDAPEDPFGPSLTELAAGVPRGEMETMRDVAAPDLTVPCAECSHPARVHGGYGCRACHCGAYRAPSLTEAK